MKEQHTAILAVIGYVGAHVLACIYDGDLLKILVGADILIVGQLLGVKF